MEQKKPDWIIGDLYKNAWQIVKNNKILWLFGMALGAGSFSSNYSNSFNQKDLDSLLRLFDKLPKESTEATKVLGSSTSGLSEAISSLFSGIPPAYYVLLGFEVLVFIVVGIITSIIYSSWAHAALLEGIQLAISKGKLTIRDLSEKAFGSLKGVLYVSYVPYLLLGLCIVAVLLLFAILAVALPESYKNIALVLLPILLILFFLIGFILTFVLIWAVRIVVIDKKPAKLALKMGYKIARKKFWASTLLGLVNSLAVGIVYLVLLLPMLGLIVGGALTITKNTYLGTGIIVLGAILLMLFILVASILEGIISAFKATVWSLAYNSIKGKYEK